uniref:Signal peptidase complex subunit 1 n=1 Tax=Pelusios castaneus TaxID=367368 RepID=A0A8C8RIM2_9SAUR
MGRSKAALLPANSAPAFRTRSSAGVSTRASRSGKKAAVRETVPPSSSNAGAGAAPQDTADVSPSQGGSASEACAAPGSSESRETGGDAASLADAMLDILGSIPTQMDYKGQKLAEQIFQGIILVSAVIGFIYGYIAEQFGWTVYIVMAGFALSCLLTLPPWPMYRRNPLKWLPVQETGTEDKKPAERKLKRHTKS